MDLAMFENLNARGISFKEAKRILTKSGNEYSDEEVKKIIDYLYALAELEVEHIQTRKVKKQLIDLFSKKAFDAAIIASHVKTVPRDLPAGKIVGESRGLKEEDETK